MTAISTPISHVVVSFFERHNVGLNGERLVVALSGGLDSVSLTHILSELDQPPTLILAHVNHHLRADSNRDEAFCVDLAKQLGLPIIIRHLDPNGRGSTSVEAWARDMRYAALEEIADEQGAKWIVTAHHADDQAETVLMRLAQGASMLTLAGIRPSNGRLLRPLLDVSRDEIERYASDHKIKWVDDASNYDSRYLRNRVRHEVLSRVANEEGSSRQTLVDLSRIAQRYEKECIREARGLLAFAVPGSLAGTVDFPAATLQSLELELAKMTIRLLLQAHLKTNLGQVSRAHWQSFRQFVRKAKTGKIFDLNKDVSVLKNRDQVVLYSSNLNRALEPKQLMEGLNRWSGHSITFSMAGNAGRPDLWLRPWQAGQRSMTRAGHHRLVSDLMADAKLSLLEKWHWPVVTTVSGHLVWLPGLGERVNNFETEKWGVEWHLSKPAR